MQNSSSYSNGRRELLPTYSTAQASGADVRADIAQPSRSLPAHPRLFRRGPRRSPVGYEIQVRPRSGFAAKNQVTVLNTPGTIDADYRGEICVILINHGKNLLPLPRKCGSPNWCSRLLYKLNLLREEYLSWNRNEGRVSLAILARISPFFGSL